jgi:hypothetical protein
MAETQAKLGTDTAPLEIYYMRLNQDQVDARLGKLRRGQVVQLDRAKATRWAMAGIADQVSSGEFDDMRERRSKKMSARQDALRNLNEQAGMWDVSTYRDVLTAPEAGLRAAYERGIPLVNIQQLRDEDGDPLPADASIEEILEARLWTHPDLTAPFAAHDNSSVMGGGSPYRSNVPSGPMPLNPTHRAIAEQIAAHDSMAQAQPSNLRASDSGSGNQGSRAAIQRARTLQGSQSSGQTESPPPAPAPPPPKQGTVSQPNEKK